MGLPHTKVGFKKLIHVATIQHVPLQCMAIAPSTLI